MYQELNLDSVAKGEYPPSQALCFLPSFLSLSLSLSRQDVAMRTERSRGWMLYTATGEVGELGGDSLERIFDRLEVVSMATLVSCGVSFRPEGGVRRAKERVRESISGIHAIRSFDPMDAQIRSGRQQ